MNREELKHLANAKKIIGKGIKKEGDKNILLLDDGFDTGIEKLVEHIKKNFKPQPVDSIVIGSVSKPLKDMDEFLSFISSYLSLRNNNELKISLGGYKCLTRSQYIKLFNFIIDNQQYISQTTFGFEEYIEWMEDVIPPFLVRLRQVNENLKINVYIESSKNCEKMLDIFNMYKLGTLKLYCLPKNIDNFINSFRVTLDYGLDEFILNNTCHKKSLQNETALKTTKIIEATRNLKLKKILIPFYDEDYYKLAILNAAKVTEIIFYINDSQLLENLLTWLARSSINTTKECDIIGIKTHCKLDLSSDTLFDLLKNHFKSIRSCLIIDSNLTVYDDYDNDAEDDAAEDEPLVPTSRICEIIRCNPFIFFDNSWTIEGDVPEEIINEQSASKFDDRLETYRSLYPDDHSFNQ